MPEGNRPPIIKALSYTQVNANFCTLVNEENLAAKWDPANQGCIQANLQDDNCLTKGLN